MDQGANPMLLSPEMELRQPRVCLGQHTFAHSSIVTARIAARQKERHISRSVYARVKPIAKDRWDYRAEIATYESDEILHTGVCTHAGQQPDGSLDLTIEDFSWRMANAKIRKIAFFGMSQREMMYWLPLVSGLAEGVQIDDLELDEQVRPFLYAVPLQGLTAIGEAKSLFVEDFGIVAGEKDDVYAPLLAHLQAEKHDPVWHVNVPKACGMVLATNMLQAERRALDRAQFTADIANFSLSTGVSHFETRNETQLLAWDTENAQTTVGLHPSIVLWEVQARKGWIRSFPLVDSPSLADLGKGSARIAFFTKRFLSASQVGDIRDQNGRRELTDRERKLAAGVQRALKWYGISAREQTTGDQFIAIWVALESILDSINYPGVFAGNRATVRDSLVQTIDRVDMSSPEGDDDLLTLTRDMFKGRLLQDVWPVRKKLEIFARSFGIHLLPTDTKLVSHLSSVRGKILHSGRDDTIITGGQLRELQHLVERLVIAAAEGAYKNVEDSERYQLRFGDVGPQGGFAPVSLDGRHVSYRWSVFRDPKLGERWEFAIEGKIFDQTNADLSYMREDEGTRSQEEPE